MKKMVVLLLFVFSSVAAAELRVASKKFTESVILGEIAVQIAQSKNIPTENKAELGGTRILWNALLAGDIDIYPDYSGTLLNEILVDSSYTDFEQLNVYLKSIGIIAVGPLGFNNSYALGVLQQTAQKYALQKISDLDAYPEFVFGFTNEFMDREDGWPSLRTLYQLPQKDVRGLDHDLAYKALESATIDVMDLYSTDAEIQYYNLFVLQDDQKYFPDYQAYFLVRKEVETLFPDFYQALLSLKNSIDVQKMIQMNAAVKIDKIPAGKVATDFVNSLLNLNLADKTENLFDRLYRHTLDHLLMVIISLSAAILISIPLGVFSVKNQRAGRLVLSIAGILQTIPSLAILVFMIPLLGIGAYPAMTALFLYSLLPIIRNTYSGIADIPGHITESARAMGLSASDRIRFIELPLATRSILAGIKTAAVINVGTATLGALIGAGGYGQPILTGIRLDDTGLILEGAVPAAVLALIVQGLFDILEKRLVRH